MHHLFIISGPGGSGKDSIIDQLVADTDLNITKLVNYTSRHKRAGEQEGVNYFFVTKDQFEHEFNHGNMVEWEIMQSNHHYYGTHKLELNSKLEKGNVICAKMPIGALELKKIYGNSATTIFIDANNDELERRLLHTDRTIEHTNATRRLEQAKLEREHKPLYDYVFENHDGEMDNTVKKISDLIKKQLDD